MLPYALLMLAMAHLTPVHDQQMRQSLASDWMANLSSKKGLCCSFADGSTVKDVDWQVSEGMACEVFPSDAQNHQSGKYCVRLNGKWWLVPDNALIEEPNRYGPAVVWPIYVAPGGEALKLIGIRCFMPGAFT